MKKFEINWFKDFSCLCGSCPQTCCRGWVIPLSDQDCDRFRKTKGLLAIRLFIATGGWIRSKFNSNSGKCPFYRRDGLCTLQKEKGHDFIPWTCQSYPRFYRNYGSFEECCLDLSCIGAARLFIRNRGDLGMTESEADPVTRICTTNDDPDFLRFLMEDRVEMAETAMKEISGGYADILFDYAIYCQDCYCMGGEGSEQLQGFKAFYDDRIGHMPAESFGFPLPAVVLKAILASSLCHPRLRITDPNLYKMFRKASERLRMYDRSKTGWQEDAKEHLDRVLLLRSVLGSYLAYYLHQYWLRTYETYSFRRQVSLGLCHVNMVLLLVISVSEKEETCEEELARIIAAYNRRAYFNDGILDEMYRIFEDCHKRFIQSRKSEPV